MEGANRCALSGLRAVQLHDEGVTGVWRDAGSVRNLDALRQPRLEHRPRHLRSYVRLGSGQISGASTHLSFQVGGREEGWQGEFVPLSLAHDQPVLRFPDWSA